MTVSKAERKFHRKAGARCFNETWDYLEKKHRSAVDDRRMLDRAHVSRFHWNVVGTPLDQTVGDGQISRVYAALGQPELALRSAKSSLELFPKHDLAEYLATGYEALARAYAVATDHPSARKYLKKAREYLDASLVEEEGREVFQSRIHDTERLIKR